MPTIYSHIQPEYLHPPPPLAEVAAAAYCCAALLLGDAPHCAEPLLLTSDPAVAVPAKDSGASKVPQGMARHHARGVRRSRSGREEPGRSRERLRALLTSST